nr:MAG TPA: 8-demethylnovobiocic acid C(8)-methyltransferase [Caudoviricetes sp.]
MIHEKGVPLPFVQCLYRKARTHHYDMCKGRYTYIFDMDISVS